MSGTSTATQTLISVECHQTDPVATAPGSVFVFPQLTQTGMTALFGLSESPIATATEPGTVATGSDECQDGHKPSKRPAVIITSRLSWVCKRASVEMLLAALLVQCCIATLHKIF
jgi:hypothetical protein